MIQCDDAAWRVDPVRGATTLASLAHLTNVEYKDGPSRAAAKRNNAGT